MSFLTPGGALGGRLFARMVTEGGQAPPPTLTPGTRLGPFEVHEVLGRGGGGCVYVGRRVDGAFEQRVAIKVLGSDDARTGSVARECNLLSKLQHPGIAHIIDGGEIDAASVWFAMELVEGVRLDRHCREGSLAWGARMDLLLQICDAVHHAHQRGVIHGDLKPGNILVDGSGSVRLLDFGIARSTGAEEISSYAFTPAYASPEQIAGLPTLVASDVYQIGRLALALFTGDFPAQCTGLPNLGLPPLPPAARRNLAPVLDKATMESPDARYASVAELHAELSRVRSNRPSIGARRQPGLRIRLFATRHPRAIVVSCLLGLGVLAIVGMAWQQAAADHARAEKETEERRISNEFLTNLLRQGSERAQGGAATTLLELLDRGAQRTLKLMDADPARRAIAVDVLARAYLDVGQAERARDLLRDTLADLDQQGPALALPLARLTLLSAKAAVSLRALPEANAALARARALMSDAGVDPVSRDGVAAAVIEVQIAEQAEKMDEARALVATWMQKADRPGLADSREFAELLELHWAQAYKLNHLDVAAETKRRVWRIYVDLYGADSPAALHAQQGLIGFEARRGRFDAVDTLLDEQEAVVRKSFGERSADFADVLYFRCAVALERNRFEIAEGQCRQALTIYGEVLGPSAPPLAATRYNHGRALLGLNQASAALDDFNVAIRIGLGRFPPTHQPILVQRLTAAEARCRIGEVEASIGEFDQAASTFDRHYGALRWQLATHTAAYARCLIESDRRDAARTLLERYARIDPKPEGMTEKGLGEVVEAWRLLDTGIATPASQ